MNPRFLPAVRWRHDIRFVDRLEFGEVPTVDARPHDWLAAIARSAAERTSQAQALAPWVPVLDGRQWVFNAYAADEQLRVSQRSYWDATGLRTVFSEYRYDPLGRRILVRNRWDQDCIPATPTGKCLPSIDRTIWDGDQILAELRAVVYKSVTDGGDPCPPDWDVNSCPNNNSSTSRHTQEGLGWTLEVDANSGAFAGWVRYTHAGGIDEPLAIWKSEVTAGIVPHRSWRGLYEAASYLGSSNVNPTWPARQRDAFFAPDARLTPIESTHWLGSVVEGKTDPSGLMYMRNRYYDPKTGRFTQEDPIGLAGGLNLYGFAGGDPVNFGDPFGLCPPKTMAEVLICTGQLLQPAQGPLEVAGGLAMLPLAGGMGMLGEGITTLGIAGRAAASGPKLARALGAAGEAASGLVKNTRRIASATGTAAYRVPDGLTTTALSEVKNVAKLSLTNQLRDFAAYAGENGLEFNLFIRRTTELSKPLVDFIRENGINIKYLK